MLKIPPFAKPQTVTANAKKTTTVNKMNDRDIMPTAHSSTFGFCRHVNPKQKTKRARILPTRRHKNINLNNEGKQNIL